METEKLLTAGKVMKPIGGEEKKAATGHLEKHTAVSLLNWRFYFEFPNLCLIYNGVTAFLSSH